MPPKKPTGQDPAAGTFYCPAPARPLMLADTRADCWPAL